MLWNKSNLFDLVILNPKQNNWKSTNKINLMIKKQDKTKNTGLLAMLWNRSNLLKNLGILKPKQDNWKRTNKVNLMI